MKTTLKIRKEINFQNIYFTPDYATAACVNIVNVNSSAIYSCKYKSQRLRIGLVGRDEHAHVDVVCCMCMLFGLTF